MRYTLRLLTLDQLGRAATLICALEPGAAGQTRTGPWPFEIGLWVAGPTPNRMGAKGTPAIPRPATRTHPRRSATPRLADPARGVPLVRRIRNIPLDDPRP